MQMLLLAKQVFSIHTAGINTNKINESNVGSIKESGNLENILRDTLRISCQCDEITIRLISV